MTSQWSCARSWAPDAIHFCHNKNFIYPSLYLIIHGYMVFFFNTTNIYWVRCLCSRHIYFQLFMKTDISLNGKIYNGRCWHIFSILKSIGMPCTILQRYHPSLCQYKIPAGITFNFFICVMKPDKARGGHFKREILGFFILLNEYTWSLISEVFRNIK